MKIKVFISIILTLLSTVWLNAETNYIDKLEFRLQRLVRQKSLSQQYQLPSNLVIHREGTVATLIKVSNFPQELEMVGVNVRSVAGNIVTADVPISSLLDVAKMKNVVYVEAARRMKPCRTALNISVPDINVNQIWNSNPNYTGKDVIVGVIDSGIDWQHQAFTNPDGSTRILAIWEQVAEIGGQTPDEFDYGTEWTKQQIDDGECSEVDINGHGTHVTSAAAGNPVGNQDYVGVAPEADIIFVKYAFSNDTAVDAAKYIFDKAEQLGKPAVINMSFGTQVGPHDGRTLQEQALNALVRQSPGRTIVAAAGNDGGIPIHIGEVISASRSNPQWTVFRSGINSLFTGIQIWYDSSDSLDIRLLVYANRNLIWNSGWIIAGESVSDYIKNAAIGVNSVKPHQEYSDLGLVEIEVASLEDLVVPLDKYLFEIQFSGQRTNIDGYCIDRVGGHFLSLEEPEYIQPDAKKTVISPASAEEIVAVASYNTKSKWIDISGTLRETGSRIGEISVFSSQGPLRNGVHKPDIAAPGSRITAARSVWSYFPQRLINYDENFVTLQGTSMASPHVTGVVALIFEQNPDLTASEIKRILRNTAIDRSRSGWDARWGAGQINPLKVLNIPSQPKNLTATVQNNILNLTWTPNRKTNLSGYRLLVNDEIIDVGNSVEYQIARQNLPPDDFTVSVIAYNSAGNESSPSESILVKFDEPIEPPTEITVREGNKLVELRWNESQGHRIRGYKIYTGKSPGTYSRQIRVGKVNQYLIKNLTNNIPIYIALTAYDEDGNESEKSEEIKVIPHIRQPESIITDLSGWPKSLPANIFSSPAIADIDGDGKPEIIIGCCDNSLNAWHHDGSIVNGFPVSMDGPVTGAPAVGDIELDNQFEIVVAAENNVTVLNPDGRLVWEKRTDSPIRSAPVLVNIDNTSELEVITVTVRGSVYAWHHNGRLVSGFPVRLSGTTYNTPAAGDIDRDGELEFVVNLSDKGLYVFNSDGSIVMRIPFESSATYASPVIADLDFDGDLEIIVSVGETNGTGRVKLRESEGKIYVFDSNGNTVSGWPVSTRGVVESAVAIGDIDNDNDLEIVAGDNRGLIYIWHHNGTLVDGLPLNIGTTILSTPILANVDDDDESEIITAVNDYDMTLIYILEPDGTLIPSRFYGADGITFSTPAFSDLDNDRDSELTFGTLRTQEGQSGLYVIELKSRYNPQQVEWGSYQGNLANTGLYSYNMKFDVQLSSFEASSEFEQIKLNWTTQTEIGVINWNIYRSENPESGFEKLELTKTIEGKLESHETTEYQYIDQKIESGKIYYYYLEAVGMNTKMQSQTIKAGISFQTWASIKTKVGQNFPNPANPETWIPYKLAQDADITLSIYDINGILVREFSLGRQLAGIYTDKDKAIYWDGRNDFGEEVASGVYFYRFQAGDYAITKQMVIVK